MKKEKITLVLITLILLFGLTRFIRADIVEISVDTDKLTYLLDEEVVVSITAYNPNPDPVILYFGDALHASYLMDDVFDWSQGKVFAQVISNITINPYESKMWERVHGLEEMNIYPLSIGTHTVVGEVVGYGQSLPTEFDVVPEPSLILLMGMGSICIRLVKRNNSSV
jgi:Intracellular proteinase inhibitor